MKKRLFIAAPLQDEQRDQLFELVPTVPWLRKIRPEKFHITILFLGSLEEERVSELKSAIQAVTDRQTSFELVPDTIKFFPEDNPRMLWLSYQQNPAFTDLVQFLQKELQAFRSTSHLDHSNRALPHTTLGYLTDLPDVFNGMNVINRIQKVVIDRPVLYESVQKKSGSEYREICRFSLSNP